MGDQLQNARGEMQQSRTPLFTFSPNGFTRWLIIATAVNSFLGWLAQMVAYYWVPDQFMNPNPHGFVRLFDLSGEANIPTLFSVDLFAVAAILSFLVAAQSSKTGRHLLWYWRGLGLLFTLFSIDDFAQMHEGSGNIAKQFFTPGGYFLYPWVVVGIAGTTIFFLIYLRFLIKLPAQWRWLIVLSGAIFVSGALGMEMVGAHYDSLYGYRNLTYFYMTVVEETLENVGIVLMSWTLVQYLKSAGASQLIVMTES